MHLIAAVLLLQLTCPCAPVVAPPIPKPKITFCVSGACQTLDLAAANELLVKMAADVNAGSTIMMPELQALADAINAEAVREAK